MQRSQSETLIKSIIRDRNLYLKFCDELIKSALEDFSRELNKMELPHTIIVNLPVIEAGFYRKLTVDELNNFVSLCRKLEDKYKFFVFDYYYE